jgi:hypothetical protein
MTMKLLLLILLLSGCAAEKPTPWIIGEKTAPPFGCTEMRTEGREVDC